MRLKVLSGQITLARYQIGITAQALGRSSTTVCFEFLDSAQIFSFKFKFLSCIIQNSPILVGRLVCAQADLFREIELQKTRELHILCLEDGWQIFHQIGRKISRRELFCTELREQRDFCIKQFRTSSLLSEVFSVFPVLVLRGQNRFYVLSMGHNNALNASHKCTVYKSKRVIKVTT